MLDYFYGSEAEQYTFYRIPKVLFTDPAFRRTSMEAKLLYGLMLDRMGLSIRNNWIDPLTRRVYIYFTLEDAMQAMGCGHTKAVALFAELDKVGLIERKKQGQGRPTQIYLKNFTRREEVQTSGKRNSRLPKLGSADFRIPETNKTDENNTEGSDINLSYREPPLYEQVRQQICDAIEYPILVQRRDCDREILEEIVELLTDTLCDPRATIRIGGQDISSETVRNRLQKLTAEHILYVMECLLENTSDIRNIRSYLLTALYNAPTSKSSYYTTQAGYSLNGSG